MGHTSQSSYDAVIQVDSGQVLRRKLGNGAQRILFLAVADPVFDIEQANMKIGIAALNPDLPPMFFA